MSASEQFDSILKELPTLKAPGVSGSRIKKLTDIAVKNVNDESQLITLLYSNCKATPSSHKLGSLYVVDSIVRVYMDEAKKQNQEINSSSPDGTFAAGVYKISELIESLVDDALELLISKSQNTKISKLVDIWERAETFKPQILQSIRQKHFKSTTPPGTPPRSAAEIAKLNAASNASAAASAPSNSNDSGSILLALASLAKNSNSNGGTPQPAPSQPAAQPNNANNILSQLSALAGGANVSQQPPAPQQPVAQQPPAPQPQFGNNGQQGGANEQYIFNMLQQMQNGGAGAGPGPNVGGAQLPQIPQQAGGYDRRGGRDDRSNNNNYSRRNRSRSPNRFGQNGGQDARRIKSPPRFFNQPFQSNDQQNQLPPNLMNGEVNMVGTPHYRPRNVGFDQTLPQGSFKVLSRTLFIGGVPRGMDDKELASVLRPYAEVQSVILNSERKHAFVKVYSRREAEQVITSFNKDNSLPLRTRWGVGFGPRDCCNYQHGISIIPILRLTDADKTWVVHAQWGGTGGQPLSSGMVIDEPDIEIGAGISSKAMSKKMPTNSARNGPKSNKPGEPDEDYVKTTLIPQSAGTMSHGSQPDFSTFSQSSVNPLTNLFNNNGNQGFQQPGPEGFPPNFMNQGQGGANANLSAQLANFFQNGGQQR